MKTFSLSFQLYQNYQRPGNFSSQRSPKFMNPSPTPSPHHPYLLFIPVNSLAPLSQSSNLCRQKRFLSSFVHCPISHLLLTLPTTLLKKYALTLSPILSKLANLSFSTGIFISIFKKAQVLPFLKSQILTQPLLPITDLSPIFLPCQNCSKDSSYPDFVPTLPHPPTSPLFNQPTDSVSLQKPLFYTFSIISPTYVARAIAPSW